MSDRREVLELIVIAALAIVGCVPTPVGRSAPASPAVAASAPGTGVLPGETAATGRSPSADPAAAPSFIRPTPNPSPTFLVYVVLAGDTLTSVARQFGTTARSIAYWNRAQYPSLDPESDTYQPDRIKVGWILLLIPSTVVDEDELPDPTTVSPTPEGGRRSSGAIV